MSDQHLRLMVADADRRASRGAGLAAYAEACVYRELQDRRAAELSGEEIVVLRGLLNRLAPRIDGLETAALRKVIGE